MACRTHPAHSAFTEQSYCWQLADLLYKLLLHCAVPDIHGDINKCVVSLELAGVLRQVDQRPIWCGGNTVVVQLGDVLDRGDTELGMQAATLAVAQVVPSATQQSCWCKTFYCLVC